MKKIFWAIIVVIIIVLIISFNKGTPAASGTIKIGVIGPHTGDAAVYGEPARNIYQMVVDEINTAGGIKGQKLELVVEDGKCNGKDASNAAEKLVNVDKVQAIIGGWCSSESLTSVPIAAAGKVALFSAASSNPNLTGISPFYSRDYPSDASQGKILADVAFNDKGYKKIALIQEQTDYAAGVYKAFSEEYEKLGGTIVYEQFPTTNTDFRSVLSKLKDAKTDALFIDTQTPAVAVRILIQMSQLKWKPVIIINDAISGDPETMEKNAVILEGALTAQFGIDPSNVKFQEMLAKYKAKYGAEPPYQSYAQTEYDAVYLLRDALTAVGNDGTKIAAWLKTVKDWPGASGSVTIGADGDRVGGHTPLVVKGGKVVPYVK